MKRTLIEVFCGLCALVLMVSLHQQIARLEEQQQDVTALERKVEQAVASVAEQEPQDLEGLRQQILEQTEQRMRKLETELADASHGSQQA